MASKILLSTILALLGVLAAPAEAFTIHESADVEMREVTVGFYPVLSLHVKMANASGDVLRLGDGVLLQSFTGKGFLDEFVISNQIQAESFGDWSVGMVYGNRRFIFHPGLPGGGFQIEDATDSYDVVNRLDMGFTPSTMVVHNMTLSWDMLLEQLTIEVENGEDAANSFVFVWTPDAGFDPTGLIGTNYHDGLGVNP